MLAPVGRIVRSKPAWWKLPPAGRLEDGEQRVHHRLAANTFAVPSLGGVASRLEQLVAVTQTRKCDCSLM